MNLKILGCGPVLQGNNFRNCSGYLIDRCILFDCGPGVWRAMQENDVTPAALEYLVLTHFHVDHISDVAPVLMARYLTLKNTTGSLRLIGPRSLPEWYDRLKAYCGDWCSQVPVELIVSDSGLTIAGYTLMSAETGHTTDSLCYRLIDSAGTVFFYSGDSGASRVLERLSWQSDLALFEASNTEESEVEGHMTPYQAGETARNARVKSLLLTHMYPEVTRSNARLQAARCFKGKVLIAADGMSLEFNAG